MIFFSNNDFNNDEVSYLTFDNQFNVEVNMPKIKIILGPNGVGKSSIYRSVQANNPDYCFIDYGKVEEAMLKRKNELVIASKITNIVKKEKEIQEIVNNIDLPGVFKEQDLNSKQKCKVISDNLYEYKKDTIKTVNKFRSDKLEFLFNLDDDLKIFIKKYGKSLVEQTVEEAKLKEIRDNYKRMCLKIIDNYLEPDEFVCPVCNTKHDTPIKNIVKESLSKIEKSTNIIVNDYILTYPNTKPEEVLEKINKLKSTFTENKIDIEVLENYFICGGNKDKANYIIQNKERINQLNDEISALEIEKTYFYENIKKIEFRIREIFVNQLGIPSENISFDDDKKELKISLERDITKYSTGEINLITFIVTLLEFMYSDCNKLVIDDPLSSYDIPNQYRIMYEITKTNAQKNCFILILTHNIDCINIANSQYNNAYEFYIMDKISNKLYLNELCNLGDNGFNVDYLLNELSNRTDYNYTEYIKLLSNKDGWEIDNPDHKLFHYDGYYSVPNSKCNNDDLAKIIEDLNSNTIVNDDSVINSANKILYLAALRVWIEKQFFENTDDKIAFAKQRLFSKKIIFMIDGKHWTGQAEINKEYLMSKKVMLNQNEHAKSQKEPFYYALSLSTDDIIKDIIDIKKHFNNEL